MLTKINTFQELLPRTELLQVVKSQESAIHFSHRPKCNLEEGESLYQKAQKKFRAHDPPTSSSDALTTESVVEVLWQEGSKFNYDYTRAE